jgi:oligosaccharide repeat unit polymerase
MRRGALLLAAGVAVFAAATTASFFPLALDPPTLAVLATLVVLASGMGLSWRRHRDPLAPTILVSLVGLALYVARPLYLLSNARLGSTRSVDDIIVDLGFERSFVHASLIASVGFLAFYAGTFVHEARSRAARRGARSPRRAGDDDRGGTPTRPLARLRPGVFWPLLVASLALVLVSYLSLIRSAGGFEAYLTSLALRSEFFYGRGYYLIAALPLKILAFLLFALVMERRRIRWRLRLGLVALLSIVVVSDLLTGGRAALLLGTLLPFLLLYHYRRRRVPWQALLGLSLIALILLVGMRVLVRDIVYVGGSVQRSELLAKTLRDLPENTLQKEAAPYDSLVLLMHETPRLQLGKTYLPIVTFPIPRRFWEDKPLGGGNYWFTTHYFPNYYANYRVETSISFFGESYLNFGIGGVIAGSFLLGSLLSWFYQNVQDRQGPLSLLAYAVTLGYVLTLLRGDAFQSLTRWGMTMTLLFLVARLILDARRESPATVPSAAWRSPTTT